MKLEGDKFVKKLLDILLCISLARFARFTCMYFQDGRRIHLMTSQIHNNKSLYRYGVRKIILRRMICHLSVKSIDIFHGAGMTPFI